MALIKLYEAANATTFLSGDSWQTPIFRQMYYSRRDDACLYFSSTQEHGTYKIFRDGTAVRRVRSLRTQQHIYDTDADRLIQIGSDGVNYLIDPMHHLYDPNTTTKIGFNATTPNNLTFGTIYRNELYNGTTSAGTTTVNIRNPSTGTILRSFQTVATLTPFVCDLTLVTPDGLCILVDVDNGTYCVLQFYDLSKSTLLYETTIPRAYQVAVDPVNRNIISASLASGTMQVHSFQPAPYSLVLSMGSNRSRYKSDSLTVTLTGSQGEKITNWPIGWRLTQPLAGGGFLGDYALGMVPLGSAGQPGLPAEGDLDEYYQVTDENGQVFNLYCGPGAADFVGQSATIQAWTGY